MKLRWFVKETDHGMFKPDWPKSMSFGRPWQQFRRTKPVLQYLLKNKWHEVPTVVESVGLPANTGEEK